MAIAYSTSPNLTVLSTGVEKIIFDGEHYSPLSIAESETWLFEALERMRTPRSRSFIAENLFDEGTLKLLSDIGVVRRVADGDAAEIVARGPNESVTSSGEARQDQGRKEYLLTLLIEQGCNLGCSYCLNGKDSYAVAKMPAMSIDVVAQTLSKLREKYGRGLELSIAFFGGEPLLGWRNIIEVTKLANSLFEKTKYDITTNLTFMPDEFVRAAIENQITFTANIDGPQQIHDQLRPYLGGRGSYAAIVKNISKLRLAGLKLSLRTVMTKINQHVIHETVDLHRELGAFESVLTLMRGADSDKREFGELYPDPSVIAQQVDSLMKSRRDSRLDFCPARDIAEMLYSGHRIQQYCGVGKNDFSVINYQGDRYDCVWFVGDDAFRKANVEESFETESSREVSARFASRNGIEPGQACASCGYRPLCGGPCPATRIMGKAQSIFETERRLKCAVTKPIVNNLMRFLVDGVDLGKLITRTNE